jgi:DNA-binding IclR family transcriptional regulator
MRQTGHRDKKTLYTKILKHLNAHPEGCNAFQISTALRANTCTIRRTYLPDLVAQGKLTATPIGKRQVLYKVVTGEGG